MQTIGKEAVIEFEEKKSKFIGYIKPVSTVEEAEQFIASVKSKHTNATHNVPVYRVIDAGQEHLKYNDDGEPSGTAGKPMADIAVVKGIYNFALVATRYFGGVKLGAGGLIRMYAKTAKLAIEEAGIVKPKERVKFNLRYAYDMTMKVKELLHEYSVNILSEEYTDMVSIIIEVDKEIEDKIDLYNVEIIKLSGE